MVCPNLYVQYTLYYTEASLYKCPLSEVPLYTLRACVQLTFPNLSKDTSTNFLYAATMIALMAIVGVVRHCNKQKFMRITHIAHMITKRHSAVSVCPSVRLCVSHSRTENQSGLTHRPLLSPPWAGNHLILCFRTRGILKSINISLGYLFLWYLHNFPHFILG